MAVRRSPGAPGEAPAVPAHRSARARARAEVTAEILASARRQLASDGPSGLLLRAVARDLGMVSSAVYRYVATRDELLTRLITQAYDDLGAAVEASQEGVDGDDLPGRFSAACRAGRRWAMEHPHEYGLVFGAPILGYAALEETVASASRTPAVLASIIVASVARRSPPVAGSEGVAPDGAAVGAAVAPAAALFASVVPLDLVQRSVVVWSALFGHISFELFGHLLGSVEPSAAARDAYFEGCVSRWASQVGLGAAREGGQGPHPWDGRGWAQSSEPAGP